MVKKKERDGFHMIDGKQTDIEFHKEDIFDKKKDEDFKNKINKLYQTRKSSK